jgi:hypothetical protein
VIYLASPYSHPDPNVRAQRFETACQAAAMLIAGGEFVFCPVAHAHPIAAHGQLPTTWQYWDRLDRRLLAGCYEVYVLTLDGWRESEGVQAELAHAEKLGMPIRYLSPEATNGSPRLRRVAKEANGRRTTKGRDTRRPGRRRGQQAVGPARRGH